ncbi:MAG: OsmC family protein [Saprospiraceae bacterium]
MKNHIYKINLEWTGNKSSGTFDYRSYSRDHEATAHEKYGKIFCSSDSNFRGDASRYNPEELFLSSISSCHMLWYLHLCSINHIIVLEYVDKPRGTMIESENGSGHFSSVTLHPQVIVSEINMIEKANALHHEANKMCFIANSCNFDIGHEPRTTAK